jgi:hypothetical protein
MVFVIGSALFVVHGGIGSRTPTNIAGLDVVLRIFGGALIGRTLRHDVHRNWEYCGTLSLGNTVEEA